jgi:hypothetical protein
MEEGGSGGKCLRQSIFINTMRKQLILLLIPLLHLSFSTTSLHNNIQKTTILKIEMHLSAFGVESDNFPSIEAHVDFIKDSSNCTKSYYNPAFKGSTYQLSNDEIKRALELLQNSDLYKLKQEYKINETDQPISTIIIYTDQQNFKIKDYGLEGDYPLQDLYKIVYKF